MIDNIKTDLDNILDQFNREKSDLIPALQAVQAKFGYLPEEAMRQTAHRLKLSESAVFGVATFYSQFRLEPSARHAIKVCSGTACHVRGKEAILNELEKQLNIRPGETTRDLEYSLEVVACLGSCAIGPIMVVDETIYGYITPAKVSEILTSGKEV
jgi:NADH-quinone oxidoreductase subunit E